MKHQTALVALSIILAFLWTYYHDPGNETIQYSIKPLKRIEWPNNLNEKQTKQFIQEICNNRTAIVITNHPYFNNINNPIWTPNDLIKYFDSLEYEYDTIEYKSNKNCPIFEYYEEELPLIDILQWKPPNNNTKLNISMHNYWQYISKQTTIIKQNMNISEKNLYLCNISSDFNFYSLSTQLLPTDSIIKP
eukprot:63085_1